jgi:hydroxyacylglutathione hydrolase
MEIVRLPILLSNYAFVLVDRERGQALVVDPGEAEPILAYLHGHHLDLQGMLITHHHRDHIGGILALKQRFPSAPVYGGSYDHGLGRIPAQDKIVRQGDALTFADHRGQVWEVPGHTLGHVVYYWPGQGTDPGELFCGDTIFGAGCGRLFEGTPAQMWAAIDRLRQLPPATRLWYAHEYTLGNLQFALTIEPHNTELQERYRQTLAAPTLPTSPSSIELECRTNPFLRWDAPAIGVALQQAEPVAIFAHLRQLKDHFCAPTVPR